MDVFAQTLRQPDQRSCGAAVCVVAGMLADVRYAELVLTGRHPTTGHRIPGDTPQDRFGDECLAMHRRLTGPVDLAGRLQLPWPAGLGTPPWAVERQLATISGRTHETVWTLVMGRRTVLDRVRESGGPAALYVGSRWVPRHVLLVLDDELAAYEPGSGRRIHLTEQDFLAGTLDAGWPVPDCAVVRASASPAR